MYTVIRNHKGALSEMKVKMNVQTAYRGDLLRAGKIYEIDESTAMRWVASKLAEKVKE
ncbi:hypothetical protein ACDX78_16550 [Virgibacillus oceani]